jgi:hypothetical protein
MRLEDYFDFLAPDDIRLKGHRIGIDDVLYYYLEGYAPEEIAAHLPTLTPICHVWRLGASSATGNGKQTPHLLCNACVHLRPNEKESRHRLHESAFSAGRERVSSAQSGFASPESRY